MDETKFIPARFGYEDEMNSFFFGNEYEIAKNVFILPHCHSKYILIHFFFKLFMYFFIIYNNNNNNNNRIYIYIYIYVVN